MRNACYRKKNQGGGRVARALQLENQRSKMSQEEKSLSALLNDAEGQDSKGREVSF